MEKLKRKKQYTGESCVWCERTLTDKKGFLYLYKFSGKNFVIPGLFCSAKCARKFIKD